MVDEKRTLYDALGKADVSSIHLLVEKISTDINSMAKRAGLSPEDIEELVNDVVVVTIFGIRKGKFQFMDLHPASYALGVARKLIANRVKKNKLRTEELHQNLAVYSDFSPDAYLKKKERQLLVGALLDKIGDVCRQLLRLKYYEHLRDKEIIEKGLTSYNTVGALKSKRSQCLKKLAEIAKQEGAENMI
jgi:RNA polymerase sigma factor (sigma-70 family)